MQSFKAIGPTLFLEASVNRFGGKRTIIIIIIKRQERRNFVTKVRHEGAVQSENDQHEFRTVFALLSYGIKIIPIHRAVFEL